MTKKIITILFYFSIPFFVHAQLPETLQAIELNKEGKNEEAFELFSKVKNSNAFKKDTLGMMTLGSMYLSGKGTIKDAEEGVNWSRMAAEKGCKHAKTVLGIMYYMGDGVKKDYKTAAEYLTPAAEGGEPIAMLFLGDMYSSGGKGISRNDKECVKWFRAAANKGNTEGLYQMAQMFENGTMGVVADKTEAIKLYEKAANKSQDKSICAMGRCNLKGIGLKVDEEKAFEWFNKIPEYAEAQYYIGTMYRDGWGEHAVDSLEAKKWLKKAAKQSYTPAQKALDAMDPTKIKEQKASETEKLQADLTALVQSLGVKKSSGGGNTQNGNGGMNGGNNNMPSNNENMSIEEVVAQIKQESSGSLLNRIVEEGRVEKGGEYPFTLKTVNRYRVVLVMPYVAQGYTPKVSMYHQTKNGSYDYHFDSDWGNVKQIGGHSVVSMTFKPTLGDYQTTFVAKINSDGYLMIIEEI